MLDNSKSIQLILYHVDDEFRQLNPDLQTSEDDRLYPRALRIAESNGLLYPFCKSLIHTSKGKKFETLIKTKKNSEESQLKKLAETLHSTQDIMKKNGFDFSVIKLYRGIAYAPRDVDLLIRSEEVSRAMSCFQQNGFAVHPSTAVEIRCEKKDFLKVDLYAGFYYLSLPFIDEEFMWKNPRIVQIQDTECPIPSAEADLLLLMIHSLLGHRRISLLDFLYAKNLMKKTGLGISEMLLQADKHGWSYAFAKTFSKLKNLYKSIYFDCTPPPSFPFIFSTKYVFEAFESFTNFNFSFTKKTLYAFSALMDAAYHEYMRSEQIFSLAVPEPLKNIISAALFKIRDSRGDRKFIPD